MDAMSALRALSIFSFQVGAPYHETNCRMEHQLEKKKSRGRAARPLGANGPTRPLTYYHLVITMVFITVFHTSHCKWSHWILWLMSKSND
jgi:hypothetical protein